MKVFLTGASGYIGSSLASRLISEGHELSILLRDPVSVSSSIRKNSKILQGDIFNVEKLKSGTEGCDWVFHLAAYAKPTSLDKSLPYRTNVEGTRNILEASITSGVKKIVYTSTGGTMGWSCDGQPVSEETNKDIEYHTEYERTKSEAEKIAISVSSPSTEIVIVNPTRVFGPGKLSKSNSVTRIMKLYGMGLWRIIPGDGNSIGNYSFINDIVSGHIFAAEHGKGGERYILGGENISFSEFFEALGEAFNRKRKMIRMKSERLKKVAQLSGKVASVIGKPPVISEQWIDKYLQNWILSSDKAMKQICYRITPFEEAVDITVGWIKTSPRSRTEFH
jgi:farnesol dehydrogenase